MKILIIHNFYKIFGGEDQIVKNQVKLFKKEKLNIISYFKFNEEIDEFSKKRKILFLKEAITVL